MKDVPGPIWWLKDIPNFLAKETWPIFWPVLLPMMLLFVLGMFLITPIRDWNKGP